ncbi:MAG: hypothetical protein MHM6MM_005253, partial [Cercozoa sp. M6MM]
MPRTIGRARGGHVSAKSERAQEKIQKNTIIQPRLALRTSARVCRHNIPQLATATLKSSRILGRQSLSAKLLPNLGQSLDVVWTEFDPQCFVSPPCFLCRLRHYSVRPH